MGVFRFPQISVATIAPDCPESDEARQAAEILLSLWWGSALSPSSPSSPSSATSSPEAETALGNHDTIIIPARVQRKRKRDQKKQQQKKKATTLILSGFENGKPRYTEKVEEVKNEIVHSFSR